MGEITHFILQMSLKHRQITYTLNGEIINYISQKHKMPSSTMNECELEAACLKEIDISHAT
jgi:hypothetical protein